MSDVDDLIAAARRGDRRSIARLLTAVENGTDEGYKALSRLYADGADSWTVGVTGAPGSGKSTLVDALVALLRRGGAGVAVLAIDPSSPFTGGALLGDRIRMQSHAADPGVFVRSMANRGHLGGIAESTPRAVATLAGLGFGEVIIETVGVGQAEVDVASAVDTTLVVVNPGWGDAVQAAKAGLLEIADVFVVNKADRPGADATARELTAMLDVSPPTDWHPPILETVATEPRGVEHVLEAIDDHRSFLADGDALAIRRRAQAAASLRAATASLLRDTSEQGADARLIDEVASRSMDPWTAARTLLYGN